MNYSPIYSQHFFETNLIGFLGIVISAFLAIWVYRKQRKQKKFSYIIEDVTSLINVNSNFRKRFKISFDDEEISDLSLVLIEFYNDGTESILANDFEDDILITFENPHLLNIRLLSSEIIKKTPEDIKIKLHSNENVTRLEGALLNRNDKFKVQLLIDCEDISLVNLKINARIAGVSKIENKSDTEKVLYPSPKQIWREVFYKYISD